MDAVLLLLVFALIFTLQSILLTRFGLRCLTYSRYFSAKNAFEGETAEFVEVISNKKLLFMPWLRLESRVSPFLKFDSQEETSINAEQYHKSIFSLMPYSKVTRRHRIRLQKRGCYRFRTASVTWGDLLGLSTRSADIEAKTEICVYPKLLSEQQMDLPSSRWQGEMIVRRWIVNDPFLVNGIRPYREGDSPRDIHWPATARTGDLQIRTHDPTADPRMLVILNVQKSENQWSDLMDYEQDVIEYGISLAATLCLRALSCGIEAGFAANMPTDDNHTCTVMLPQRNSSRDEELLNMFARLRILRVRSFATFLDDLGTLQNTDILILSSYESDLLQEKMSILRIMGNTVALNLLPVKEKAV